MLQTRPHKVVLTFFYLIFQNVLVKILHFDCELNADASMKPRGKYQFTKGV